MTSWLQKVYHSSQGVGFCGYHQSEWNCLWRGIHKNTYCCLTLKITGLLVQRFGMSGTAPLFRASYSKCTGFPCPLVKQLGCETVCLLSSSASFRNQWSCTSLPPCGFLMCIGTISPLLLPSVYKSQERTYVHALRDIGIVALGTNDDVKMTEVSQWTAVSVVTLLSRQLSPCATVACTTITRNNHERT